MKVVCLQTGRLLERRNSGLSAAEGLCLEDHLATCASCRADANLLQDLSSLARETTVRLSASARERAIANALAATALPQAPRAVPQRKLGLLLGAAAALLLGTVFALRDNRAPVKTAATTAPSEPSDRVLSGQVQVSGNTRAPGAALSSHAQLQTSDGAVLALGHARVELRAQAAASWDGTARTLDLQQGSVLVEVDPSKKRSFRVETKAFAVQVLGTRFEVTQSAVHVLQGRVSVTQKIPGGDAAPIVLSAGSDRSDFELQPPAADEPQPKSTRRRTPSEPRAAQARAKPDAHSVDASALLEQARSQLAARDVAQARATLAHAAPHLHAPALRAQALSLEAECELQARHFAAARDTYLQVAQKFAGMPAAETALFAAARIEAEHGEPAHALELLNSYLEKYPRGSFAREAERRMKLLPGRAPAERTR